VTKAERLLGIINVLKARRTAVTAGALAAQFAVSERTIYRDIQSLELSGVPVAGEAGVGYRLLPQEHLAPLTFTEKELEALMLGARLAKNWMPGDIAKAADASLTKIRAVLPDRLAHELNRRSTPYLVADYHLVDVSEHADKVRDAIVQKRIVEIDYKDGEDRKTRRRIWPLGILFWGQVATLCAWCEKRKAYRSFRMDRILKTRPSVLSKLN
jgi:predicted DNA-binding transcriptional regulator YafY